MIWGLSFIPLCGILFLSELQHRLIRIKVLYAILLPRHSMAVVSCSLLCYLPFINIIMKWCNHFFANEIETQFELTWQRNHIETSNWTKKNLKNIIYTYTDHRQEK